MNSCQIWLGKNDLWAQHSLKHGKVALHYLTSIYFTQGDHLAWETSQKWECPKMAPENARGGVLQNWGALGECSRRCFPCSFPSLTPP